MIGPIKAYKIVMENLNEPTYVRGCREYKTHYVFILSDSPDNPFVGRERFLVNRNTGKFNSSDDDDAPKLSGDWTEVNTEIFRLLEEYD